MGFQQGLSGLNVSSKALDAIGNNIANASTVGFKTSQVQFADVYAASLGGGGGGQIGIGASAPSIAQLFTQGNITTTNNPLDMAINGGGFYRLSDGGTPVYSRNGQFSLDKDGYMVNPGGLRLTGYGADASGAIVPGDFVELRLSSTNIEPSATTASQVQINLDSRSTPPTSMSSGSITGAGIPTLAINPGSNDQLTIVVDGVTATVVVPAATYATSGDLAAALEKAINANSSLVGANALVSVTVNTSGYIQITSNSSGTQGVQGAGSTVNVDPGGANDASTAVLGTGTPTVIPGADNFSLSRTTSYTGSTAQTVYDSLGNPHNMTMYFAKTSQPNVWQFYNTLDGDAAPTSGNATGSLVHTAATAGSQTGTLSQTAATAAGILATDTFTITVDGTPGSAAIVPGASPPAAAGALPYGSTAAMIADLQTQINADPDLILAGASVTVSLSSGRVVVMSNSPGATSAVSITGGAAIFGATLNLAVAGLAATYSTIAASDTFDITVDGVTASVVPSPPATGYATPANMTADLQTQINAALSTANAGLAVPLVPAPAVTVSLNGGRVVVTSDSTGGNSNVVISNQAVPVAPSTGIFGNGISTFAGGTPLPTLMTFDTTGALTTAMPLSLSFDPKNGATNPLAFDLDFTGSSQYGINFGVNQLLQDGYTSGRLTGLSVSSDGTVQGRYSNGKTRNQGQVVLVNFNNANGLTSLGNNVWGETSESGQPIPGTPGQGSLGLIQSAAVEESNTDLTAELVAMIMQQRVYQANSQTIKTQDQVLQTLVNLR